MKVEWKRVDTSLLYKPFLWQVSQLLDEAWGLGLSFWPISGFRDYVEQSALYAQGRTAPGVRVTDAQPGESPHNFGLAVDVCLDADALRAGLQPNYQAEKYEPLRALALKHGLVWGGRWGDGPHLQLFGYVTAEQLRPLRDVYEANGLLAVWDFIDAREAALIDFKCVVSACTMQRVSGRHLCFGHYAEWQTAPEHKRAEDALAAFVLRVDSESERTPGPEVQK